MIHSFQPERATDPLDLTGPRAALNRELYRIFGRRRQLQTVTVGCKSRSLLGRRQTADKCGSEHTNPSSFHTCLVVRSTLEPVRWGERCHTAEDKCLLCLTPICGCALDFAGLVSLAVCIPDTSSDFRPHPACPAAPWTRWDEKSCSEGQRQGCP